ncbi:MAG: hypothetical protein ACNS61_16175 [Candidatus Wenzhouxiangella sp. M2_3B_020]
MRNVLGTPCVAAWVISSSLILAACGPAVAQVDPLDQYAHPLPESGRWFANDGTRTGFFIEVQDGIVAGLHVGGDADGDNAWLSFSGSLVPGATTEGEGIWILESDLLRFSGAGCIVDCADAAVGEAGFSDVGDIRIYFRGRTEATVWIDDRPGLEIAPIYFGVERATLNETDPPLFLPDLEGKWVVASAGSSDFPDRYLGAAVIEIGARSVESFPIVGVPSCFNRTAAHRFPIVSDPDGMFPADSKIDCSIFECSTAEPDCGIVYPIGPMSSFTIDFDSISDARFTVLQSFDVAGDSIQYQLFRLNHD